jgi:outer membrane receptor protein involved in Fe transport
VVRAPAPTGSVGQLISLDGTYLNFGATRQEGIDASVQWKLKTGWGAFVPAMAASYMSKFEGSSTPGSPVIDRLSRANSDGVFAPRWKGLTSLGWSPGRGVSAWLAGRYIGSYYDYTPTRKLGDIWYFDGTLELDMERMLGKSKAPLSGLKLLVSGTNLANKLPSYSTSFRGYDPYNYDLVGRTFFVRLKFQT